MGAMSIKNKSTEPSPNSREISSNLPASNELEPAESSRKIMLDSGVEGGATDGCGNEKHLDYEIETWWSFQPAPPESLRK